MMTDYLDVPFNKPFVAGKELYYIAQAVVKGKLGGDGYFAQACAAELQRQLGVGKILFTPSCTAALEMAALLCEFESEDEVIMPSFTFVSTATAFVRAGATPVFADVRPETMNIDERQIESLITAKTKAICVVHYAGVACNIKRIAEIAAKHELVLIEDAAQAVNSFHQGQALGTIGDLGCYSFHETKNFICGEGGALCINRPELVPRAEIIRDKGTNRQRFFRGEVDKYTWIDCGSSYVMSEICSAFLFGQLEQMAAISARRAQIYQNYFESLNGLQNVGIRLPTIPDGCRSNYHLFHLILPSLGVRDRVLERLRESGVHAVFHYVPLHSSPAGVQFGRAANNLPVTSEYSSRLLRLPFFHDMTDEQQEFVCNRLKQAIAEVM